MIVSHNEIISLVQKAFLGTRNEYGEADLIANMVAELQMAGLEGIRQFNNASDFLFNEQEVELDIINNQIVDEVVLDENDEKSKSSLTLTFDFHGNSIAYHLPAVLDYALEHFADDKHHHIKIELKNCHNRWLAYGELVRLAVKGIACMARWDNGAEPRHTLFILNLGNIYPELYFFDEQVDEIDGPQDMIIELADNDFVLERYGKNHVDYLSSEEILKRHQSSWDTGIKVNSVEWDILKETAKHMLVKNSEQSMRGAGGV
ncbi:DUF3726 domain-containing protein [Psychrobacter raelei]|uniref:DUF3726 domain-containing protein n=1 Tax=Psychrobacter raelei TaxID=2565531 RepID=UPI003F6055D2